MNKMNAIHGTGPPSSENIKVLFDLMGSASEKKEKCAYFVVNTMTEFGDSQDAVGELVKEVVYGSYDVYLQAFTRAIENGYIPATKNPKVITTAFLAMLYGTTVLRKVGFGEEIQGVYQA